MRLLALSLKLLTRTFLPQYKAYMFRSKAIPIVILQTMGKVQGQFNVGKESRIELIGLAQV